MTSYVILCFSNTLFLSHNTINISHMKKFRILLIFTLFLSVISIDAQRYSVHGTYNVDGTVVYLVNLQAPRGTAPDSVVVKDGQFRFSGEAEGKLFARLIVDKVHDGGMEIILDGDVVVDYTKHLLSGTPENDRLNVYYQQLLPLNLGMSEVQRKYSELPQDASKEAKEQLVAEYEKYQEKSLEVMKKAADENQQNIFPAHYIRNNFYYLDRKDLIQYADNQAAFMTTPYMAQITKYVEGWKRAMPGVKITDIVEADTLGVERHLTEFVGQGNYVLIDFWASWCGPCMREMPHVKALYEKYHPKGFDIVGLSFDRDKKAWIGAINRLGIKWHHLSDLQYWNTVASKTYGVASIPYTLLVSPDGTIVEGGLSSEMLAEKLKEIYGE